MNAFHPFHGQPGRRRAGRSGHPGYLKLNSLAPRDDRVRSVLHGIHLHAPVCGDLKEDSSGYRHDGEAP